MLIRILFICFSVYYAEAASLWLFESPTNIKMAPLTAPESLLDPPFNVNLTTVIYAFGYNGSINDNTTLPVINAYLEYKQRCDINVVLMNWEREARIVLPLNLIGAGVQYPITAILNTRMVGDELGAALLILSELGLDLDKVHLSGHSLGAHLMGYAGKVTRSSGKNISRITGLDPAGPLFEGPVSLVGLQPGDARFVDVIHTNPILFGDPDRLGDVDIRFNCDMLHQPGCPKNYLESCSHFRAPLYFAESINSPRGFVAVEARTCLDWRSGRNNRDGRILFWGENIDTQARGTYYLRTNRSTPFERDFNYVHAASLWVYESKDNYVSVPLTSPLGLLNTSFNVTLNSVFYAFGFNGSPDGVTSMAITNAYMELKKNTDVNYVLLNWEKEATSKIAGPIIQYPTTGIHNAKIIGEQLGVVLLELSKHGLDLDKVHLLGHSLGAQLLSASGKNLQKEKKIVGRITGLDPAGPLFNKPTLLKGLNKDDATFVVAIHTDPQLFGTFNNVGHIDIWPNCDLKFQPGCPNKFLDFCSHNRAPYYYAEAINFPKAYPSVQADSCRDWKTKKRSNDTHTIIYMGENIDRKSRGKYYLRTNKLSPFGKGLEGIEA